MTTFLDFYLMKIKKNNKLFIRIKKKPSAQAPSPSPSEPEPPNEPQCPSPSPSPCEPALRETFQSNPFLRSIKEKEDLAHKRAQFLRVLSVLVKEFCQITGDTVENARKFLAQTDYELDGALTIYYSMR